MLIYRTLHKVPEMRGRTICYIWAMFLKKVGKRLFIAAALFMLFIVVLFTVRFKFSMNIEAAIMASVFLLLAYILYLYIEYLKQPKTKVTVVTKVKLTSPPALLKSVMTYKLKIESEHHIEDRGKERRVKMDQVMLSFNSKDHPNIYEHCLMIVSRHTESFMSRAEEKYPDAKVESAPLLLPEELKKKRL
jgi:hypothetical protein